MSMDVERLRRLDLFAELDYHDLSQVVRWVHEVNVEAGDVLMEQGAMPYEMLVIESGTVEVIRDGEVLATLGTGDPVGEMSLLRQERRMATVRAVTTVAAVAIRAADLAEMESEMPEVLADIRAVMDERQRRNLEAGGRD
jgi:CRP-like cAMP-binding protein